MGRMVFGVILGLILAPIALLAWLYFGHAPVAVADPPLPKEHELTHLLLHARMGREMPGNPPIMADEADLTSGAQVYRDQCAVCHGFHGHAVSFAAHMYPPAPGLWEKRGDGNVVGVSDDPVGVTYWKVTNGMRLTGMPAFKDTLTETQIWQVSLLLANADKPLPPSALEIVRGESPAASAKNPER